MKNLIVALATIAAILLVGFGFYHGVYPNHDRLLGCFLLLWALIVVWVGGLLSSYIRAP